MIQCLTNNRRRGRPTSITYQRLNEIHARLIEIENTRADFERIAVQIVKMIRSSNNPFTIQF